MPKIIFIGFLLLANLLFYWFVSYAIFIGEGEFHLNFGSWILGTGFWLILTWMTFYMIRSLLRETLKISIKKSGLEIIRPFLKSQELYSWDQIKEFYTSYEYNKQRSLAQIIIYFEGKKKLKISEESIMNYNEMVSVLKSSPVKYAGFKEQALMDFE